MSLLSLPLPRLSLSFRLLPRLALWNARFRARHRLADLPQHLVADIGLTATQVHTECEKPFWKA